MSEQETTLTEEKQSTAAGREPILDPAQELPSPDADAAEGSAAAAEALAADAAAAKRIVEMAPGEVSSARAADDVADVSRAEFEQLKAERDQLLDRVARLQAEFENARKRAEREKADFRDFATGNVVEQFLPVLDNFELALKSTGSVEQMRSGVALIVKQMEETLARMQVAPVPTVGEPFDPHVHEALGSVERDDIPDQHVAEEIRRGYKVRDKLLRPALVRVAHNAKQVNE